MGLRGTIWILALGVFLWGSTKVRAGEPVKLLVLIAEGEYRTAETLPPLVREIWNKDRGYDTEILIADHEAHNIPKLEAALERADVLLLRMRRQVLPETQLASLRAFLRGGKTLLALRTSSHPFCQREPQEIPPGHAEWREFDSEVLGCQYEGHYGHKELPLVNAIDGAENHPILQGVTLSPSLTMRHRFFWEQFQVKSLSQWLGLIGMGKLRCSMPLWDISRKCRPSPCGAFLETQWNG